MTLHSGGLALVFKTEDAYLVSLKINFPPSINLCGYFKRMGLVED